VRADIQGLRAIAVGVVVLFHAWPNRMPGGYVGVDAFFVISGFLISAHLLEAPPAHVRDLARFWARRIRRLLPAALTVLVATLAVSRLVAPPLQWTSTAREAIAAAFYVENWSLADQALDYLAADSEPTPVQHFWSLSVEEQFYLVWPILMAVAVLIARRTRRRPGTLIGVFYLAVLVGSLWLSIRMTNEAAAKAYFVTYTRAWEFAVGGLTAWVVQHSARWRGVTADLAAWVGLGAIVVACFAFTSSTPFPGYAAALPVLGTALVLLAHSEGRLGPGFLWRLPTVQWQGDVSYSVYLWHWPALLLTPFILRSKLFWPDKLVIIATTLALAGFSKVFIEDRFRIARPGAPVRYTYAFGAAGMTLVMSLGLLQVGEVRWREARDRAALAEATNDPCFGAAALVRGPQACPPKPDARVWPSLALADEDKSEAYADDCFVNSPYVERTTCTYGSGATKVALVGNSHAGHWLPPLQALADRMGWTITTYLGSVCNISDAKTSFNTKRLRDNCVEFSSWVNEQVTGRYDLIITSQRQSATVPGYSWATTAAPAREGYRTTLRRWVAGGSHVVVIQDVVAPPVTTVGRIPVCLARHHRDSCEWPLAPQVPKHANSFRWMDPLADAARSLRSSRVRVVVMDDLLCPGGTCQPVIGQVVTYFDASHLTATYARTLAPALGSRIAAGLS